MFAWIFRRAPSAIAVAVALTFCSASAGMAQQMTAQQFEADPGQILTDFPNGGLLGASTLSQILIADPAALPLVMGLLANTNDAQSTMIGTALGYAAIAVRPANPGYFDQIQTAAIATTNPQPEIIAYNTATGGAAIGAVGGGGGGGAGGGGGPTNAIAGIGTANGSSGASTPLPSFGTSNRATGLFTFSSGSAGTPGASNSVSP
jgi:hypothetical protein